MFRNDTEFLQQLRSTILKIFFLFCETQVNCVSPITGNDDWSHKGGHKQIFRPIPRGRITDGESFERIYFGKK